MANLEEKQYVRTADFVFKTIPRRPDSYVSPPPRPLVPIPNTNLAAILIQGLGSTSDRTDQERFYIRGIADLLDDLGIPYLVFSYQGHVDLNYAPWDTVGVPVVSIAKELTHFVSAFPSGDILLFAHSAGGNIAAFWACTYAERKQLDRIAGTFFLASPLLQPTPAILETAENQKHELWRGATEGYSMKLSELAERLQYHFVVIRYWKDALAPIERSSFVFMSRDKAPLSEIVIRDTGHSEICSHYLTLAVTRKYITRILTERGFQR
jgi:pimeloyl-ACP methyl ester carboxylesterase